MSAIAGRNASGKSAGFTLELFALVWLFYTLLNCHGHIEGDDGDGMVDSNPAPTHLPKQGFFYIPQHIDMLSDRQVYKAWGVKWPSQWHGWEANSPHVGLQPNAHALTNRATFDP